MASTLETSAPESAAQSGTPVLVLDASGDSVVVPGNAWMLSAQFSRSGPDLVLTGHDGKAVLVRGYFSSDDVPDLQTEGGAVISGDLAVRLAGPVAPSQVAQAAPTAALEPIGKVAATDGTVTITHVTGEKVTAVKDTPVFQGDTIETGKGAAVGITFVDDSTFSLGDSGRMVIDEMVYDPGTKNGEFSANLVQGVFSFVSGQIAKTSPDGMIVKTPVATIGIRGTKVAGRAAQEGEENTIALMPEIDAQGNQFVGELTVSNAGGTVTLNQVGATVALSSAFQAPPPPVIVPVAQLQSQFGAALNSLPPPPSQQAAQDAAANGNGENGNGPNGEGANGEGPAAEGEGQPAEGEGQPAEGEGAPPAEGEGVPAEGEGQLAEGAAPDGEAGPAPDGGPAPGPGEGGGQLAANDGANGPDAGAPLGGDAGAGAFGTGGNNPFGGGGLFGDSGGGGLLGDTGGGLLGGDDDGGGIIGGDGNLLGGGPNLLDSGNNLLGDTGGDFGFVPPEDDGPDDGGLDLPPPPDDLPSMEEDLSGGGDGGTELFDSTAGNDQFDGTAADSTYLFDQNAGLAGTDVITDAGGDDLFIFDNLNGVGVRIDFNGTDYDAGIYNTTGIGAVAVGVYNAYDLSQETQIGTISADGTIENFAASDGTYTDSTGDNFSPIAGDVGYVVAGTAGNDSYIIADGVTTGDTSIIIFGKGGGTDSVTMTNIYANAANGATVTLDASGVDFQIGSTLDGTLYGIESITGTANADSFSISGDVSASDVAALDGGAGNDNFVLNAGTVYNGDLRGDTGTDTVYFGLGATFGGSMATVETAVLQGTAGNDVISAADIGAGVAGLAFTSVIGGAGTDSLTLDGTVTAMNVTAVEDITGTATSETIYFDSAVTGAVVDLAGGTDLVSFVTASGNSSATLSNVEAVDGSASYDEDITLATLITAGTVDLYGGTDKLTLADGTNDLTVSNVEAIVGGTGTDSVTLGSSGAVSVDSIDYLYGSAGTNTVTMTAAGTMVTSAIETIVGSAGADTIFGDLNANVITGGDGADVLKGGAGSDTFIMTETTAANDTVYGGSTTGDGTDSTGDVVDYSASTANLTIALGDVSGAVSGTAAGTDIGTDTLIAIDYVIGGSGNDTVTGNAGDNAFTGGAGNDAITGGAGTDVANYSGNLADFVFGVTGASSTLSLTDGNTGDSLNEGTDSLSGVETLAFADATISVTTASGEQQVNTTTTNSQDQARIVALANGGYAVYWHSTQTDSGDIYTRVYNALGQPVTSEIQVNQSTGNQYVDNFSEVQPLNDGGFVVMWNDTGIEGTATNGTVARIYDSTGTAVSNEFLVNTTTANDQLHLSVAQLAGGDLIFTWQSKFQDDASKYGIYGRRYSADGSPQSSEFHINTTTAGDQNAPVIVNQNNGGFVVFWEDDNNLDGTYEVYGQFYDSNAAQSGSEFIVASSSGTGLRYNDVIELNNTNHDIVIAWHDPNRDGAGNGGPLASIISSNGSLVTGPFSLHTTTTGEQGAPALTALTGGGFVATWHSNASGDYNIIAQRFDDSGTPVGGEITVNTYTTDDQTWPVVAGLSDGGFVISWQSNLQDGAGYGVYSQRFDASGNAVSPQTLTGGAGNDTINLASGSEAYIEGNTGTDTVTLAGGANTIAISNVEAVTGGAGADHISVVSLAAATSIDGGAGSDVVDVTGSGFTLSVSNIEEVWGSASADTIVMNDATSAKIAGGAGADTVSYANLASALTITTGGSSAFTITGSGTDTITQTESIIGSSGNDTVMVSTNSVSTDFIDGSGGTDTINFSAHGGDVTIDLSTPAQIANVYTSGTNFNYGYFSNFENVVGAAGNDFITGDANANVITGGAGTDNLAGGTGADVFRYAAATDSAVGTGDTILDFAAGTNGTSVDSILFDLSSGFTFSFLGSDTTAFTTTASLIEARFNDSSKLLEVDTNADGAADMNITLSNVSLANLDNTDFAVT